MLDSIEKAPVVTAHGVNLPAMNLGQDTIGIEPEEKSSDRDGVSAQNNVPSVNPYEVTQDMRDNATSGLDKEIAAYRDFIEGLKLETEEDRKKRERREKSKRIIGAVSDGLRAMSNLVFTTQYAPNMYNEKDSQLRAADVRIEKMKAERERDRDAHLRYSIAIGRAEGDRAKTVRELEAEMERRKMAAEKAAREAELHPLAMAIKEAQQRKEEELANKACYDATVSMHNAEIAPELSQEKLKSQQAQTKQREASASASYASAAAHNRSKVVHHFNGKTYPKGSNDYEKDVREAARQYNQRHGGWVEETDRNGVTTRVWRYNDGFVPIETDLEEATAYGKKNVVRKAEEYAGEVETRLAEEREDKRPPSRRTQNDKTPPSRRK